MKREILFKALDDEGDWHTGDLQTLFGDTSIANNNGVFEVRSETVCQFTAELDKNVDKIFESDIIDGGIALYVVKFERATFGVHLVGFPQSWQSMVHELWKSYTLTGRNVHDGGQDE